MVAWGNEMGVVQETVDDGEDDTLPMHHGQSFHEVDGDVGPHLRGNVEGLQKTCRAGM
jgi:hypothetical protein